MATGNTNTPYIVGGVLLFVLTIAVLWYALTPPKVNYNPPKQDEPNGAGIKGLAQLIPLFL